MTSSNERQTPVISPCVIANEVFADLHGDASAVFQHVVAFEGAGLNPGGHALHHGGLDGFLLVRTDEMPGAPAQDLGGCALQQRAHGLVKAPDDAFPVGLFIGNRGLIEEIAIAALAVAQFLLAGAEQNGGILDLARQRIDFVGSSRKGLKREAVRQAAGILLDHLDAADQPAGHHQMNEEGAQRAHNAAGNYGAEQAPADTLARIARFRDGALFPGAQSRQLRLQLRHHGCFLIEPGREAARAGKLASGHPVYPAEASHGLGTARHQRREPREAVADRNASRFVGGEKSRVSGCQIGAAGSFGIEQRTLELQDRAVRIEGARDGLRRRCLRLSPPSRWRKGPRRGRLWGMPAP